jgi:hypothetical protein
MNQIRQWTVENRGESRTFENEALAMLMALEVSSVDRRTTLVTPEGARFLVMLESPEVEIVAVRRLKSPGTASVIR